MNVCRELHDSRVKELNRQLTALTQQHDSTIQQMTEVKVHSKVLEDCRDALKRELTESAENLRQSIKHVEFLIFYTNIMQGFGIMRECGVAGTSTGNLRRQKVRE